MRRLLFINVNEMVFSSSKSTANMCTNIFLIVIRIILGFAGVFYASIYGNTRNKDTISTP